MAIDIRDIFKESEKYLNKEIEIEGWIRTLRSSKRFGFIEVNDGTFFANLQVVFDETLQNFPEVEKLPISSAISVKGTLVETPEAKQPFEIQAKEISLLAPSDRDYPLQKKRHTFEYLRTIAHLRPRGNTFNAVFRVRSLAAYAIHKFFQDRGFVYVHTPIITGSDAEGAGEMFRVTTFDLTNVPLHENNQVDYTEDFFGRETNLTVSGQLEAEAYALAFKRVYTFGPTFRAENSNTPRHAAEFWMIEPEIAFADLTDNRKLAEDMMKFLLSYVMEKAPEEMKFFNSFIDKGLIERLENIVNSDFECITYTEAINLLQKSKEQFQFPVKWGMDLQTEHERYISEKVFKGPVFIIDYPKDIKAFYMRLNDDENTVAAMDLLVPGVGEIIGGSQREERLDVLEKRIEEMGMKKDDYWWYLELRKYGGVKHAGYGLGFERAIMYMTGMSNIRDVIPFPRTVGSAEF
ncbi:asparagine--tRNA ligase [Tepidimicrobium xylanilyticum]|uniref:Asparagine--tRNA ligase n=1 Tax=Tepidimicrobium xylanilyticum TaxID=1123352 RepID=A0A1H2SL13_9FIRM|nr:asparagine--tRNA ligase [Tepidimicrobium xylanilyticum]GMG96186.1 asparagine--tRNA ligase [Tepidimicrobium xylanilyticum]SDW32280.1 asparaginyl-tRNA synthetase [Tepidimicrobium xylanilyticum]